MKKIVLLYLSFALFCIFNAKSQSYYPGKLYLLVEQSSGIPIISISPFDTIVEMENGTLQQIFTSYNVYSFERTCPTIDKMNLENKYKLDKLYTLQCNCNEEHLMQEIINNNNQTYGYIDQVPITKLIYTPND